MMEFEPDRINVEKIKHQAEERLGAAKELLRLGFYNDAISRAYYAVFSSLTLLFYVKGRSFSKHKGLITAFHKDFVKTGLFPEHFGKEVSEVFRKRQESDYNASVSYGKNDATEGIRSAEQLLSRIIEYIDTEHPDLLEK
ncbi:MAG TPA: HEPN domain-containing protein [Clostridia bacterium]|nr:HEPN domain-containing protein [Clostridia bacterium]